MLPGHIYLSTWSQNEFRTGHTPGRDHDGIVAAAALVDVADVLLGDVGVLDDLGEVTI